MGTIHSKGENFFLAEQLRVRSAKPQGHRSEEPRDHQSAEQDSGQTAGSSIPPALPAGFPVHMAHATACRHMRRGSHDLSPAPDTSLCASVAYSRRRQTSPSLSKSRRSSSSDHLVSLPAPPTLAPAPSARCSAPVVRRCRYPRHLPKAKNLQIFSKMLLTTMR